MVACNTASTHALPALEEACSSIDVPLFGVVEPGVEAALKVHDQGVIAVLGTNGTVLGAAYQNALAQHLPADQIAAVACPLFVPLVEEGWCSGQIPQMVAEHYLAPLRGKITTAILGCTHYPLLKETIQSVLPGVTLIDSAEATAQRVSHELADRTVASAQTQFLVTDQPDLFETAGAAFLGFRPENTEWIDLAPARPPFLR